MKKLLLGAFLVSSLAVAGGKITIEESYSLSAKKVPPPTIGLGIWQNISGPFAANLWVGLGHQARYQDDTVQWFVSKNEIVYHIGKVAIAAGYSYKTAKKPHMMAPGKITTLHIDEHKIYGKLSLKLW